MCSHAAYRGRQTNTLATRAPERERDSQRAGKGKEEQTQRQDQGRTDGEEKGTQEEWETGRKDGEAKERREKEGGVHSQEEARGGGGKGKK